jgi:hypothetical protein
MVAKSIGSQSWKAETSTVTTSCGRVLVAVTDPDDELELEEVVNVELITETLSSGRSSTGRGRAAT